LLDVQWAEKLAVWAAVLAAAVFVEASTLSTVVVLVPPRVVVDVDLNMPVPVEDVAKPIRVIEMDVGDEDHVHVLQIDAEPPRVVDQRSGIAGVAQNALAIDLEMPGNGVFPPQPSGCPGILRAGVLDQGCYSEGALAPGAQSLSL